MSQDSTNIWARENCKNCEFYKINNDGGWCYMFKKAPDQECMQFKLPDIGRLKNG